MKKKLLVLLTILIMGILTGCGMKEDEAKAYVEATLDASYKGEFEAFVEITDSTPEGAAAMYDENMEHIMQSAGFDEQELGEELTENYKQLFLALIKKAEYSVGEAVKNEDSSFSVEVEVRPMTIFNDIEEELTEAVIEHISGMDEYPDDNEIKNISFQEMYDILSDKVEVPTYSEETVDVFINLHKNDNGMYEISEEDMLTLDNALFVIE